MARRQIPVSSDLWQTHVTLYVGIFIIALQRLSSKGCNLDNEDYISESLCPVLAKVCYEEQCRNRNCDIRRPDWEKPNQPVFDNELKGGKIRKRPDFTCKLTNPLANSLSEHEISFHVECKRLGAPTSPSWILNQNYVTEGINRFDCESHEYGKRASKGMMIGYVVSMTQNEILSEVNSFLKQHFPSSSVLEFELKDKNILKYRQKMVRNFVKPENFELVHLWTEFRKEKK